MANLPIALVGAARALAPPRHLRITRAPGPAVPSLHRTSPEASGDPDEAMHLKGVQENLLAGDVDEQLLAFRTGRLQRGGALGDDPGALGDDPGALWAETAANADTLAREPAREAFYDVVNAIAIKLQFAEAPSAVEPAQKINLVESECTCAICLETFPLEASSEAWFTCSPQPKECGGGKAGWTGCCGTRVCSGCFSQYLRLKIMEGDTVLRCPGQCRRDLSEAEVRRHVPSLWQRVEKFRRLRNNANLRECPPCGCLNEGSHQSPDMTCMSCRASFCFHHGLAHTGVACREYNRMARFAPASGSVSGHHIRTRLKIRLATQACPRCHARVQRSGGCAHMTCRCGAHFCWHCGEGTSNGSGPHYKLWGTCRSSAMRAKRLGVVLGGAVGVPVALATAPIWGPLMCCHFLNYDSD
jgi:hypothetical protein